MTDIKMSELLALPVDCHDIESKIANIRPSYLQALSDKINAYDENQERIKVLTHEKALLENQLKNALAEIAELKKKARGY